MLIVIGAGLVYSSLNCGPPTVLTTVSSSPRLSAAAVRSLSSAAVSLLTRSRLCVGEAGRGRCVSTHTTGNWMCST